MPICSNQSWSPPATRRESRTVCFVSLHSAVMIIRSRARKLNFCQNAVKELGNKSSVGINESPRPPRLSRDAESRATILVAGALRLDVSRLLALVADLLTTSGLLGAVAGVVARLATVVALHAVDTLARHMAVATARVAGLASATTEATTIVVTVGGLGAVAGNVANLTTLVALGSLAAAAAHGAVTGDVAGLAALVAGLVILHGLGAVTAHVALATAVVALSRTLGRAVTGLVASRTARVASATGLLLLLLLERIHFEKLSGCVKGFRKV